MPTCCPSCGEPVFRDEEASVRCTNAACPAQLMRNLEHFASKDAMDIAGLGPAVLEGQDWVQWLEKGYIDEVFPMNYHTELDKFQSLVSDYRRLLGDQAYSALHIGVGVISSMGENPPAAVAERLQILKEAKLPGVMLFNKTNIYNDEYCKVIKEFAG